MKTGLRAAASVVLGLLLWFVLFFAFAFICAIALANFPTVANIVDWLVRIIHADHLYNVLIVGIPAIVPAIIVKPIMKGASEKAQEWTLITLIAIIAIVIMAPTEEGLSLLEKLEGIIGVGLAFWVFGKEDLGDTCHISKRSITIVLLVVAAICVVMHVSQNADVQLDQSNSKTYKVAGVTFDNDNGTSRQQALADLMAVYGEGKDIPCRLVEYEYLGEPAFHVYVGTKIIGNIPADAVAEVKSLLPGFEDTSVQIGKFAPDGETIYYARVTIGKKTEKFEISEIDFLLLVLVLFWLVLAISLLMLSIYIRTHPFHSDRIRRTFVITLWLTLHSIFVTILKEFFILGFLPTVIICLLFYYFGKRHYIWITECAEQEQNYIIKQENRTKLE